MSSVPALWLAQLPSFKDSSGEVFGAAYRTSCYPNMVGAGAG